MFVAMMVCGNPMKEKVGLRYFLVRRDGVPGELLLSIEVSMSLDDKFS